MADVGYRDRYGDRRTARVEDVDPGDLWEGVDYEGIDTRSDLPLTLRWDEAEGWSEVDR